MANRPPPAAARLCSTPSSGQASSVKRRRIRARTPDSRHSALPPRPENGLLVLLRLLPIPLSLASSSAISEEGKGGKQAARRGNGAPVCRGGLADLAKMANGESHDSQELRRPAILKGHWIRLLAATEPIGEHSPLFLGASVLEPAFATNERFALLAKFCAAPDSVPRGCRADVAQWSLAFAFWDSALPAVPAAPGAL